MNPRRRQQRGAALLALVAGLVLGAAWLVMNRAEGLSTNRTAAARAHNAQVLMRAKAALIGYVAAQAGKQYEDYPGAIPCPEAAGYFDNPTQEGQAASTCTLPKVGRFPWRTIGTEKLVDAAGEPLWFVVSDKWGYGTSTNRPVINSNSVGQLTVDGVANAAVALIIAPGAAMNVTAATGCSAVSQVRPTSGSPDWRNYLECENATYPTPDASFVTTGPSSSFNDQVLAVMAADLLPAIEAAVAKRIEEEVAPVLQTVYSGSQWGTTSTRVFPFPAPFANPSTSNYQGDTTLQGGLLPFNYSSGCNPATDPRCTTTLLAWQTPTLSRTAGSGTLPSAPNCSTTSTYSICEGYYRYGSVTYRFEDKMSNVAKALRTFNLSGHTAQIYAYNYNTGAWTTPSATATRSFNSDASLSFVLTGTLPSVADWGYYYVIGGRPTFSDHSLLDSTASTGWFVRNEWYRLLYYAVAPGHLAGGAGSCVDGASPTCLQVANLTPANKQRALLILAGRSINGSSRPSTALTDYLEYGNASGKYEKRTVSPLTVGSTTYADTGTTNAYQIIASAITIGKPLYFKAANANTGASTLTTPAISGARSIVNEDGSVLTSGQIPANGVVQVTYDGTRWTLRKLPYNDRLIVVDQNT